MTNMASVKEVLTLAIMECCDGRNLSEIFTAMDEEEGNLSESLKRTIDLFKERKKRVKIRNYVPDVVHSYMGDAFKSHFRMTRETFSSLLHRIAPVESTKQPGHPPVDSEKSLLVTIWILANLESYRSIGDRFNMSPSTALHCFDKVVKKLCEISKDIITWPSGLRLKQISDNIKYSTGFPGVIGAIDGTHIQIKMPSENGNKYVNRKQFPSIILQAVCDDKMIFTDCFAGYPGSVHDARVFKTSPLYKQVLEKKEFIPDPFHIIGDAAYPLLQWLMVPFKDNGHLSSHQNNFNTKLSKARTSIERAFSLLKGRFRRLKLLDMSRVSMIPSVILATCVLHNICILSEDTCNFENSDSTSNYETPADDFSNENHELGVLKRNVLAADL